MTVRKPLVLINGEVRLMPDGDSIPPQPQTLNEIMSVWNGGNPELLFSSLGEVITSYAT